MKHHIATYTKAILLMALMLLLPSMMRAEKEAWVGYDIPTSTLTFYYNESKGTNTATYQCYSLNEDGVAPAWSLWAPYATTVVFDESFKQARPTTCYQWFASFEKLTTIEGIKNLNTSNVTNMAYMFSLCSSLVTLDLSSSTFSTTKVTSTKGMFRYCSALKELNTSKQFSVSSSCDASDMFEGCVKLPGYKSDKDWSSSEVNQAAADYYPRGFFYPEPTTWVGYNATTKTLTFHHDGGKNTAYDDAATYTLNTGTNKPGWSDYKSDITKVVFDESFAQVRPTTCHLWFVNFANLTTIEGIENLNTEQVTDMRSMFYGCSSLTTLDLSALHTTAALTDVGYMFYKCSSLTKLDISGLNTSGATDMQSMFAECSQLKAILVQDLFSVASVDDNADSYMFGNCTSLPGYDENSTGKDKAKLYSEGGYFYSSDPAAYAAYDKKAGTLTFYYDNNKYLSSDQTYDVNDNAESPSWYEQRYNVTKVVFDESFKDARPTTCQSWFEQCTSLKTIEGMENLNTSEVTNMTTMFYNCESLTSLDLSSMNTSKVITMQNMFSACKSLSSLKLSDQFTGTNLKLASYLFSGCSSLKELDLSQFKTTTALTSTRDMFYGCTGLKMLDLTGMTTTNVNTMEEMFQNCSQLRAIYVSDNFTVDNVGTSTKMFGGCTSLPSYNSSSEDKAKACYYPNGYFVSTDSVAWVGYKTADKTLAFHYDNIRFISDADNTYDLPAAETTPGWRTHKDEATKIVFDESFAKARPTSCYDWFSQYKQLTTIEGLENLNTSEVTNMKGMFCNCVLLDTLDLSGFNTAKVTYMKGMFLGCSSLASLKFSDQFTGTSLVNATYVFDGCTSLTELDLSCLKTTTKLNTVQGMFEGCTALTTLYLSGLNTSHVAYMNEMFKDCSALKYIFVSDDFTTENLTMSTGMFSGCTSLPGFDSSATDATKACYYTKGYFYSCVPTAWVGYNEADKSLTFYYKVTPFLATDDVIYNLNTTDSPAWEAKKNDVTKVVFDESFKDARPTTCYHWFSGFKNLTTFEGLENLNTSEAISMNGMFSGCTSLTKLDLSSFNTANVTNISVMFDGDTALSELTISDQFVGTNVTDAVYVFDGCTSLTELDFSNFKTSEKLRNTQAMFANCTALQRLHIEGLNTTGVITTSEMFKNCPQLNAIFVSDNFKITNVSTETNMFLGSTSLPGYDPTSIGKAKACYYPEGYFYGNQTAMALLKDKTLTFYYLSDDQLPSDVTSRFEVPLYGDGAVEWTDQGSEVTKVIFDKSFAITRPTSCKEWFKYFPVLADIEGIENLNTSKVTTMEEMFYCCNNLTTLDLTTWDVSSLTNANQMFYNCNYLSNIYVSEDFVLTKTQCSGNSMFEGCEKLPHYGAGVDIECANYKDYNYNAYLTLRRHFTVGDEQYNVDGYQTPTCYTDVTFADGAAYSAPCDFTFDDSNKASYTRTVSNHWATLCLPFTYSADDNSTARFYSIKSYDNGNITATPISGDIIAGTPVLAYVEGTELSVTATGAAAVADAKQQSELKGAFTQTEVKDEDYIIANDHFWKASWLKQNNNEVKNVYVAPYRASLTLANLSTSAKPNSISIGEDAVTGIDSVTSLESLLDGAEIYDLQGRRLTAPQHGVMIIRKDGVSHKVVVK